MVTDWPGVDTPTLHSLMSLHWPFLNSYPSGHVSHLKLPSVLTQTSEAISGISGLAQSTDRAELIVRVRMVPDLDSCGRQR